MTCPDERKETTGIGSFIVERVDGGSLCTQAVGGVQFAAQMAACLKRFVRFIGCREHQHITHCPD